MKHKDIESKVLDYIRENNYVSFIEIEQIFKANGLDYSGDTVIHSIKNKNVIYWDSWNDDAVRIIGNLMAKGLVELKETNPVTYLIDGGGLSIPVIKSNKIDYKTPHWLPVVLCKGKNKNAIT